MADPLKVENLSVAYQKKAVLKDVSFSVPSGNLIGIIGPNGAGKSTLIKSILGLVPPLSGKVGMFGERYDRVRKRIGYVPQKESVDWDFPTNALDVVTMGRYGKLGWFKRPGKRDKEIALSSLEKAGMADYADRQISQLSGGQQQRVSIARALALQPKILFFDEPTSALDPELTGEVLKVIKELAKEHMTMIIVTHEMQFAKEVSDRIIFMEGGVIVEQGTPDEVFASENVRVQEFIGKIAR